jgi:hypothetical protein
VLTISRQTSVGGSDAQDQDADPARHHLAVVGGGVADGQSGPARLGGLLPLRRLQEDLLLGWYAWRRLILWIERYRYRSSQISTPYNIDEVDPNGARFRSTSHNDAAFVGEVSEYLT